MVPAEKFTVPKYFLEMLVGSMSVTATDEDVRGRVTVRMARGPFTPTQVEACVRYALRVHRNNRKIYRYATMGH